jgi:hypothetical protein
MLDLIKYLIPPPNIPNLAAYLAAPPDLSSPAKPVVGWTNPYYPIHGRSPLRNEYRVPGAWVDEGGSEVSSPSTISEMGRSEGMVVSSPATSLSACEMFEDDLSDGEEEEEEEYDPEYVTYLLASMLAEEETKERRENEEIYRIQNKLSLKREWDGKTGCVLGEKLLHFKIICYLRGCEMRKRMHVEVKMERDVGKVSEHKTGEGTGGNYGHRQLREDFESTVKKRKRGLEDEGTEDQGMERKKRRVGKVPRGILKTYLQRKGGIVAGMVR